MSNYQAIATVTATLQRILQAAIQVDLAGARITTVRPDTGGSGTPDMGVNIYMYQANPNPAWRNADLRNRRPKGEIAKQAQAGLDLHYLLTFYGNEVELEPQRLLGSTVRVLIDQPILTPEMIRETVTNPAFRFLENSTLAEQVERVTMVPESMNTEDLSKIWSVFFQTPYVLSFAYVGSTVLIEGDKSGRAALPVRSRQFYITPNQPVVEQVTSEVGDNQPILLSTSFSIEGRRLERQFVQILIGQARITPLVVSDSKIRVHLSVLPQQEIRQLRAGVQSLQVLHFDQPPPQTSTHNLEDETVSASMIRSNVFAFVLCPSIVKITVDSITDDGDRLYTAEVMVQVDVTVGTEQRVFLMLNDRLANTPTAYVFRGRSRSADTDSIAFLVTDIQAGDYLVRIQIDSAESLLNVDETNPDSPTFGQYISPTVTIP
jgi:Pvc16 N-terminal domain